MQTSIDRQCPLCAHYESSHINVDRSSVPYCEECHDLCDLSDTSVIDLPLVLIDDDPLPPAA